MAPRISVILPTVRPRLFDRCFATIAEAAGPVSYEVLVVADYAPLVNHRHTTWILSPRNGPVDATNMGFTYAGGDYIFAFNDESQLEPRALEFLYDEAEALPGQLLTPFHKPVFNFVYYGRPFAPFPFAHRALITRLGGLFDPAYHGFYADPDLSMRAHANGVPFKVVEPAVIHHHQDHDKMHEENVSRYMTEDRATFRKRWDHLGEFCDP